MGLWYEPIKNNPLTPSKNSGNLVAGEELQREGEVVIPTTHSSQKEREEKMVSKRNLVPLSPGLDRNDWSLCFKILTE